MSTLPFGRTAEEARYLASFMAGTEADKAKLLVPESYRSTLLDTN